MVGELVQSPWDSLSELPTSAAPPIAGGVLSTGGAGGGGGGVVCTRSPTSYASRRLSASQLQRIFTKPWSSHDGPQEFSIVSPTLSYASAVIAW